MCVARVTAAMMTVEDGPGYKVEGPTTTGVTAGMARYRIMRTGLALSAPEMGTVRHALFLFHGPNCG